MMKILIVAVVMVIIILLLFIVISEMLFEAARTSPRVEREAA